MNHCCADRDQGERSALRRITERTASGGKGPELVRLKSAEFGEAHLDDHTACVTVKFEAELADFDAMPLNKEWRAPLTAAL